MEVRAWANKSKKVLDVKSSYDEGTLERSFHFIDVFGTFLGWKFSYDWTWKNNPKHWIAVAMLFYSWSQILGSQIIHFANGNYKKVLEIFAIYGGATSVKLHFI